VLGDELGDKLEVELGSLLGNELILGERLGAALGVELGAAVGP
jgi:hypothetical protein